MNNTANIITSLRIIFAVGMLFPRPFSTLFWVCYLCAVLSDIFDGIVARALKQQTNSGAKFDSIADLVFACAIAIVMILNVEIPKCLWGNAACIALLRVISYLIGYINHHTFSSLHTYANKLTGGLVICVPLLSRLLDVKLIGVLLCIVAYLSALEELLINIRFDKLNRERRSLFHE